ncbi:MAG: LytTR family DNA-binding domain-containing protein, partial [Bacteroidota bacterium]
TGFDVLKAIRHPSFEIIFTTSYDEYAIEAIKNSALDYLLKPIEVDELMDAVAKLRNKQIQQPRQAPVAANPNNKIGFPVSTGQQFIDVKDIIYAKAEDNVCLLQLVDHSGEKVGNAVKSNMIRLTKSLGWVEAKLEDYSFCRVHHSYLINFQQMTEYIRNDGGYVIMSNGKAVSISRRRKDDFLDKLDQWSGSKD